MTDINPTPSWAAVRQLEIGEFALGGANGNMNEQAKSLAARTEYLKPIVERFLEARIIDLSYLKPPMGFDLSTVVQQSLNMTSIAPINLILPHGEFTMGMPVATPSDSKGITLDLNGSILKPTAGYSSPDWYLFDLRSTTNHPVVLKNGVVDGVLRKQNLFEYTNIQDYFRDATSGVFAEAVDVIFENFTLQNLYGQTTKVNCRNFFVTNVAAYNCGGHWYTNNGYDMFGDLFYIGTGWNQTGKITAKFTNVIGRGKKSNDYPENHQEGSPLSQVQYARAGLVLEKLGTGVNEVYVSFENCDIQQVERGIHQEITGLTSHITVNNTKIDSCVLFGAYLTDTLNAYATKSRFGFYDSAYSGSKGLSRGFGGVSNVVLRDECVVTYFGSDDCQVFGTSGNLDARDAHFKNVTGLWATGSKVKLIGCEVEVLKHSDFAYPSWNTEWDIKDTKIKYIGADQVLKTYTQGLYFKLDNVEFDNIYLGLDSLNKDAFKSSKLIVNNDSALNLKGTMWELRNRDGKVLNYPSVLWGVSRQTFTEDKYTYQKYQKPATGTLNIINDAIRELSKRVSLFLIVVKGHDDGLDRIQNISDVNYASGYYASLAKRDTSQPSGVKQLTTFTSVGSTVNSGFDVTIDDSFDVTAYGTYSSWVHVAVVPVTEKETLPFVPDSILNIA